MALKATKDFGDAAPGEIRDLGFDYSGEGLRSGEHLVATPTFTLEIAELDPGKTADPAPATRLGAVTIEDSEKTGLASACAIVRVTFASAGDGNRYRLSCNAPTNLGQALVLFDYIWCRAPL